MLAPHGTFTVVSWLNSAHFDVVREKTWVSQDGLDCSFLSSCSNVICRPDRRPHVLLIAYFACGFPHHCNASKGCCGSASDWPCTLMNFDSSVHTYHTRLNTFVAHLPDPIALLSFFPALVSSRASKTSRSLLHKLLTSPSPDSSKNLLPRASD